MPTRDEAMALLREFTKDENLVKHALAVEACMQFYARKYGEEEEKWRVVGLIHDFDYERFPDLEKHPFEGVKVLRERGWPEDIIEGVLAHAPHTGQTRDSLMKKAIFACDELTGMLVATALVRPSKKIGDVKVKSVKKKMKDKAFARGVNREDVVKGAEELGLPLEEHIGNCLEAMQGIAGELGL